MRGEDRPTLGEYVETLFDHFDVRGLVARYVFRFYEYTKNQEKRENERNVRDKRKDKKIEPTYTHVHSLTHTRTHITHSHALQRKKRKIVVEKTEICKRHFVIDFVIRLYHM